MYMDEGLDTGDILLQEEITIAEEETAETLGKRLAELGASVLLKTLKGIQEGSVMRRPQVGTPTYAPVLKKDDGLILWPKPAAEISNMIRGMYPWPCAYCYLQHERIKITRARASAGSGVPGRIEKAGNEFIVGTGEGFLTIIELQPEGKRLMRAEEFLRGRQVREGTFFDAP
jgi:methionyl-tRNA formyltransferase